MPYRPTNPPKERMQYSHLLTIALVLLVPTPSLAAEPDGNGWKLVWSEDFETLDKDLWTLVDSHKPTNNSRHAYLPSQVSVENGRLVLLSEAVPSQDLPYRSGQVISKQAWKHGRWEVRAKLPATRGVWPAIWLLPDVDKYRWPSGGEIDIMENRGNEPHLTSSAFHYGTNPPYRHEFVFEEQQTRRNGELVDYTKDFHTYAVDWDEHGLTFSVDGVSHFRVDDSQVEDFLSKHAAPMQLVLNTAIGGDFLPDPDASTVWPQRFEIDWVRVYERDSAPTRKALVNGKFDADGGSLRGWTTFGVDLRDNPNVTAAPKAGVEGGAALKLFGTFGTGSQYSGVSQGIDVTAGQHVRASVQTFVSPDDSIAGGGNTALAKIEFYKRFAARFDSPDLIGVEEVVIATGDSKPGRWRRHMLAAVAPEGAVEARLAIVFHQPNQEAGALFVDDAQLTASKPSAD